MVTVDRCLGRLPRFDGIGGRGPRNCPRNRKVNTISQSDYLAINGVEQSERNAVSARCTGYAGTGAGARA